MKNQVSVLFSLVFAFAVLSGCNKAETVIEPKPLIINAITLEQPEKPQHRELIGQVVAAEVTPLAFRISGEIVHLEVKPGEVVKKGQVLAILDTTKLKQAQTKARTTFELAQRQFKRAKSLFENEQLSDIEYRELLANLKLAKVNDKLATDQLGYAKLKAPMDAMVSTVSKEAFENVVTGEVVVTLYQHNQVYINVPISFDILAQLNPNKARLDYQPKAFFKSLDQGFPVDLVEYSAEPVSSSRAFEAWYKMPQPIPPILPGTSVTLEFDPSEVGMQVEQGFILPYSALQAGTASSQFYVWKLINGRAQRSQVVTSRLHSQGVLVIQGVRQGDVLLTSDLDKLRDGMAVIAKLQEK